MSRERTWPPPGAVGSLTRFFSRFVLGIAKQGKSCFSEGQGHLTITLDVTDVDSVVGVADFGRWMRESGIFTLKIIGARFLRPHSSNVSWFSYRHSYFTLILPLKLMGWTRSVE